MLPPLFLERMQALLGAEYPVFAQAMQSHAEAGLRVNPAKIAPQDFVSRAPWPLEPVPWCAYGFHLPPDARPGRHPWHAAGLYYLQEPSAMAVAEALAPRPGERILDLAAAPGGKSTHIAALLGGTGLLIANEIHPQRARVLAENLERWGVTNAAITNETPDRLAAHFGAYFDAVLVDAPCSGEGMFRKSENARQDWSPATVQACASRQDAILRQAARMVRPGGRLVYSTCTFAPEEDEGTLARFLETHPDFEVLPLPQKAGFAPGLPDAVSGAPASLKGCIRLWPHRLRGEGHFVAVLRRVDGAETPLPPPAKPRLPREVQRYLQAWQAAALHGTPLEGSLHLAGRRVYALPLGFPDLSGLRVLHPGLWVAEVRKNRIQPAHALALALKPEDALRTVHLPAQSDAVLAYLRGESLPLPGEAGWVLVCVDEFPLGWGKRSGKQLKNHYPRGLRRPFR